MEAITHASSRRIRYLIAVYSWWPVNRHQRKSATQVSLGGGDLLVRDLDEPANILPRRPTNG
jgi:hypothetical protein